MDQNIINNLASHHARECGLTDCLDELKEVIKNHGPDPFHIFRYISFVKKFLIVFEKVEYLPLRFPAEGNITF